MGETGVRGNGRGENGQGHDWPYVLKPRWIHDLLLLWRRKQPYELYLDQVTDYTVREMRDKATRRQCIAWLANHFAPSRAAATLTQNVWASYSHHFRATDLAAAYLGHLILNEPLARIVTCALFGQCAPGQALARSQWSSIAAIPGALDSFLRTLQQWEVVAIDPRRGGFMVDRRLPVTVHTFPLLVWVWWLETRQQQVMPEEFAQLSLWTWLDTEQFAAGWQSYSGRLWTLEQNGGAPTLFLHPTDPAGFARSLLNLLSTDGRRGRQWPRRDEPSELLTDAPRMSEGILGR